MTSDIEQRLAAIEDRNRRVEDDKAWERSVVRRAVICVLTYVVVFLYNWSLGGNLPYLTAFVPVGGYLFSTMTVPFVKRRWIRARSTK